MTIGRNGGQDYPPARRLRVDRFGARPVDGLPGLPSHSGRRVVTLGVLAVVLLWGTLYLVFRDWRGRVRERAAFGRDQVAMAIDPLAKVVPPDADPTTWRQDVADTHAMLVTLTGANLLDMKGLEALRTEIAWRVARTQPETARIELASIWRDMERRAGPVIARCPRPEIFSNNESLTTKAQRAQRGHKE